jgi:hypothetical protein
MLEALEDRLAPALLTVNSTADTVSGTTATLDLREAILLVNSRGTATDSSGNSLAAAKVAQINYSGGGWGTNDIIGFAGSLSGQPINLGSTLPELNANIAIFGDGAPGLAVNGANRSQVFEVNSGVTAELDNLTIENGSFPGLSGGAIENSGTLLISNSILSGNSAYFGGGIDNAGTLTISNSTLSGNSGTYGGAIFNGGILTVNGCTFSGNTASADGGGIINDGTLTVSLNTFNNNSASIVGGGIYNAAGTGTVTNSIFSGNSAGSEGGGIANGGTLMGGPNNNATVTINDSTLSGNSASYGGAIGNGATLTLTNSTLTGNTTSSVGGGIDNSGVLMVSNSTLAGNSTYGWGGGLYFTSASQGDLTNVTVAENRCDTLGYVGQGGGLWADPSSAPLLNNTIVAGNFNGPSGTTADDIAGTVNAASASNLIGTGGSGGLTGSHGNKVGVASPDLAPLGNYGGATQTLALLPGSPAIDAGSNALAVDSSGNPLTTDQRGEPRVVNGKVDIGAVEFQSNEFNSEFPTNPVTGHPTAAFTLGTQDQANVFMSIFSSNNTNPLSVPTGAATPIDINVTLASGIQVNEANLSIPSGFRVRINGGAWHGGSPALTLDSGNLTITNATFQNATDAPTILVQGGSLRGYSGRSPNLTPLYDVAWDT